MSTPIAFSLSMQLSSLQLLQHSSMSSQKKKWKRGSVVFYIILYIYQQKENVNKIDPLIMLTFISYNLHLQTNKYMKKSRGNQRKDITRALKVMKMEEEKCYKKPDLHMISYDKGQINRKSQTINFFKDRFNSEYHDPLTKPQNYRYTKQKATEHEAENYSTIKPQHSVQLKRYKFLQMYQSQSPGKETASKKNPYLSKSKNSGGLSKFYKDQKNNQGRRVRTHESMKLEENWRISKKQTIKGPTVNIEKFTEQMKTFYEKTKYKESLIKATAILEVENSHQQALFIGGMSELHLQNYIQSLKYFNKLIQKEPEFNETVFMGSIICLNALRKYKQAIQRGKTCLKHFPSCIQVYVHLGKSYQKLKLYEEGVKCFDKCLKNNVRKNSVYIGLAECYEKLGNFLKSLQYYNILLEERGNEKYLFAKAKCLKSLQRYEQYLEDLKILLTKVQTSTTLTFSQLYYQVGYAYYRLEDYSNAVMNLEEVFADNNQIFTTNALVLLTVIQIMKRDFYEAYHIISRKEHYSVDETKITFFETFCEGVVFLMKKKFKDGLNKLLSLQFKIEQTKLDEIQFQIAQCYSMYLAYAYFCEGKLEDCQIELKKQLQKLSPKLKKYQNSLQFNKCLCDGLLNYSKGDSMEAENNFRSAIFIYQGKPEGYFYLSLLLIKNYLKQASSQLLLEIKTTLLASTDNIKEMNNNYAASVFYAKSVFSAFIGEWQDALNEIDESIERAEDNISKSFYLRAIILACCQNFKQAISQVTIAISIDDKEPKYYLLRSKCLQIEGDGNRAFLDLQAYISARPDDEQIHKYAGHLLFENGAFEDAIQAYDNGEILEQEGNFDVFLTKAKTYFLLGRFDKAIIDLSIASRLKPKDSHIVFDKKILKVLHNFLGEATEYGFEQNNLQVQQNLRKLKNDLQKIIDEGINKTFGKIYRGVELRVLQAMFSFYCKDFRQASRLFKEAITLKQQTLLDSLEDDEEFEEEEKQKFGFISQMHYNRAVCSLMMGEEAAAVAKIKACQIDQKSKTFSIQKLILETITIQKEEGEGQREEGQKIDLFSQKNKMSKFFKFIPVQLKNGNELLIRLCIPFPKVQPPEINPKFDKELLEKLQMEEIQKKPQAPWILREENAIKFTDKVENYSKLDVNFSEVSKESGVRKGLRMYGQSSEVDNIEREESIQFLKEKLKLDDQIERKLHKLLKKYSNK